MIKMNHTCRICKKPNIKRIDVNSASYTACSNCNSICKILTLDEYNALNPDYGSEDIIKGLDVALIKNILSIEDKKKFISSVLRHMEWGPDRNINKIDLLDIGCGMGGYLVAASELGINSFGIEPSKDHYEATKEIFNLNIINGYLTENKYPHQKFDIIILSHVIEHIYQPKDFIAMVMKLLKTNGVLVITTPNANSLLSKASGKYWSMLKPVDHVSLLSKKSFQTMGFDFTAQTSEYPWEFLAGILSVFLRALKSLKKDISKNKQGISMTMSMRSTRKDRFVKFILTFLSLPFYLWATLWDNRSCLIIKIKQDSHFS